MLLRALLITFTSLTLLSCVSRESEIEVEIEIEEATAHNSVSHYKIPVMAKSAGITSEEQSYDLWLRKQICPDFDKIHQDSKFSPPEAVEALQKTYNAARRHNAAAQAELGDRYIDGNAVPKDWKSALCWYRAAAGNGSAYAQYWIGIFYQNGYVVKESAAQAAYWFNRAGTHSNSAAAEAQVADRYADDAAGIHDMGQALFWYERAAAKHNLTAELALGNFYANSHEPADIQRALSWYGKAAGQHSVVAVYNIGQIYYLGQAIPRDYTQAHKWFLQAAEAGYAPAQYNLADMYYRGLGVKQDWVKAFAWLVTSNAAENNPAALRMHNQLTEEFTPEQLKQASHLAADYSRRFGNHSK